MQLAPRQRSIARARQSFIASNPREGRVQRQVGRCFIAGDGKPRTMSELVRWAYPDLDHFECWHRWSVRRVLLKLAKPIGRSRIGRGAPGIWYLATNCLLIPVGPQPEPIISMA
jgi:hypothetical protein